MLLEIIILLLSIPTGYIIAWLTREELVQYRHWFLILTPFALILSVFLFFFSLKAEAFASLFTSLVSLISYLKSKDKKLVKR